MSTDELIKACLKGDHRAQKRLFELYSPKLFAVCYRYANSTSEAQDVLQDGFVKIFEKLNYYKGEGSFEGWMRRIIVNTALDSIRKNKKLQNNDDIDEVGYNLKDGHSVLSDLAAEDLLEILNTLPIGYKTVFNLYVIEGYSHKEIAEELGVTVSTSKSQFSRAKSILREIIEMKNMRYES